MTEFTGSILELNKKQALVMTDSCDFVYIQRQPEMIVGQQIRFTKAEINRTNKNYIKYFALIASVFIIALSSIFYFQIFVPSTVFAYIDIDINPSLEFVIDKNAKILDIKPLNNDAQTLLKDLKLIDLPIELAISEVVKTSEQLGFITSRKSNAILISASIATAKNNKQNITNQKVLDNILSSIGNKTFYVGTENIKPEILKVTPENRKSAIKNDISMGRYALYSKIKKDNKDITVEKAKTERVSDMLDKAKAKTKTENSNKNKTSDADSKDSNTDKKNSDNNQNDKSSGNNNSSNNSTSSKNDKEAGNFQKNENTTKKDKNITKSKNGDKNDKIKEDFEKKNNVQPKSSSTDKKNLIDEKNKNDKNSNNNTMEKSKEEIQKDNKNDKNKVKDKNTKQDDSHKPDKK